MTNPVATVAAERTGAAAHVDVDYLRGEAYEIRARGHRITVDQPTQDGGADQAATPTELFVGSLAACVAFYAGRYLSRHGFGRDGLRVRASYTMATDRPARVRAIQITLRPPASLPPDRVAALLAVASHCTVHNSISSGVDIAISVA